MSIKESSYQAEHAVTNQRRHYRLYEQMLYAEAQK